MKTQLIKITKMVIWLAFSFSLACGRGGSSGSQPIEALVVEELSEADEPEVIADTIQNEVSTESLGLPVEPISDPSDSSVSTLSLRSQTVLASNEVAIFGTCREGSLVTIGGQISTDMLMDPAGDISVPCIDGDFSFTATISDGLYKVKLLESVDAISTSDLEFDLLVDTVRPSALVLVSPNLSPAILGDISTSVVVSCETGARVEVSPLDELSGSCIEGFFSFEISFSESLASVSLNMLQIDQAGNSSANTELFLAYDASLPAIPQLNQEGLIFDNSVSIPSPLTLSGSCETGLAIQILGPGMPDQGLPVDCVDQLFSVEFTFSTVDANSISKFQVYQEDLVSGKQSSSQFISYVHDDVAPAALVLDNPVSNPYSSGDTLVISGSCEDFSEIRVSGDQTMSASCGGSRFELSINEANEGTYFYQLVQVDRAGNISGGLELQWNFQMGVVTQPVVLAPAGASYASNEDVLSVRGTCITNTVVVLYENGETLQDLVCENSEFNFFVDKSADLSDQSYQFEISQVLDSVESELVTVIWERDITAPDVFLDSYPNDPNLSTVLSFSFSSSEPEAVFECRLDGLAWELCIAPYDPGLLNNGTHEFMVRSKDLVGNRSEAVTYTFLHEAVPVLGLWHFDLPNPALDSSTSANHFTQEGMGILAGKFGDGVDLSSGKLSAEASESLNLVSEKMTIDFWMKTPDLSQLSGNAEMVILARDHPTESLYSISLKRVGRSSSWKLNFSASADLVSYNTLSSNKFSDDAGWMHVAVTYNGGQVTFFLNGLVIGNAVSTVTALPSSSVATLSVGSDSLGGSEFTGSLDELRVTQDLKFIAPFSVPTLPYQ